MKKLLFFIILLQGYYYIYAQVPDTTYLSGPSNVNNGGPACGYMISFTLNYDMPPGDKLYLERSSYQFCLGTTSPFYLVGGGTDNSANWYIYPANCWQGNSYGPQFCFTAIYPSQCSVATTTFRFVYISADGSGIVHASISNITYYLDHPPYPHIPSVSYINSACNIPQDVNFNFDFKPGCGSTSGNDIHAYISFGDGSDTVIWTYPPYGYIFTIPLTHIYDLPGIYSVRVRGNIERTIYNLVSVGQDSCSNVSGKLYADLNSNCIYDTGDSVFIGYPVRISANGQSVYFGITDSTGNYTFTLFDNGTTYYINFDTTANGLHLVCPLSGYTITTLPSVGNDFAVNCQGSYDLNSFVFSGAFVPGLTTNVYTKIENLNCNSTNVLAKLVKSPLLTFVSAQIPPDSIAADTLYWNYPNAGFLNPFINNISFLTDTLAVIGDTVCLQLIAEPVSGDINPLNNIFQHCRAVNASLDPNNKELSVTNDGRLLYTINFENTGTAYARNAFIIDTLDINLDLNTFHLAASSHPVKVNFYNQNILKFSFDSILLPFDTNYNKGFVAFTIKPKYNPAYESVIKNNAWIYFDFNQPVPTNAVYCRAQNTLSDIVLNYPGQIIIYPNPANDQITVEMNKKSFDGNVTIFDLAGKEILNQKILKNKTFIDVRNISTGIYFISIEEAGNIFKKKLVLIH